MKTLTLFPSALIFLSAYCFAATPAQFEFKDQGKAIKALTLQQIKSQFSPKEIKVHDINEQADVTYVAVPFNEVLEAVYGKKWLGASDLIFKCTDGYQPIVAREVFTKYRAYLAFERKGDASFNLVNQLQNGKKVGLAPFYLIWDTTNKAVLKESPSNWPYQLESVDLKSN